MGLVLTKNGRDSGKRQLGLSENQKECLVALALWKIERLLSMPFRFWSGCHLQLDSLRNGEEDVGIEAQIPEAIGGAAGRGDQVYGRT